MKPDVSGRRSASLHRPGPVGADLRFPTLEVFVALHGDQLTEGARGLTEHQLELTRPIFGNSIAYDLVRVCVASIANAPTTLRNFLRISPEQGRTGMADSTFIH
jgi:hypothetical protein